MEIKVNIAANDYVQPKEVRTKVVQDICDHIICWMNIGCDKGFYSLRIKDYYEKSATLYLVYKDSGHSTTSGFCGTSEPDKDSSRTYVKVRTCEMKVVFKAIQKAGYHIFGSHNITDNVHTYIFTTKPVLNGQKAKKIDFGMFID